MRPEKRSVAPPATTPAVRTIMRANRGTDTGPELAVRRLLHARGYRYFVHRPIVAGVIRTRPDLVFPRAKLAVFIDGCFWHGCPTHVARPWANREFWMEKFARNRARDRRVDRALRAAGWSVVRAWEHVPPGRTADRIAQVLSDRRSRARRL